MSKQSHQQKKTQYRKVENLLIIISSHKESKYYVCKIIYLSNAGVVDELRCNLTNNIIEHVFPVTHGSSLDVICFVRSSKLVKYSSSLQSNWKKLNVTRFLKSFQIYLQESKERIKDFKAKIVLKDDTIPKFMKLDSFIPNEVPIYRTKQDWSHKMSTECHGVFLRIDKLL